MKFNSVMVACVVSSNMFGGVSVDSTVDISDVYILFRSLEFGFGLIFTKLHLIHFLYKNNLLLKKVLNGKAITNLLLLQIIQFFFLFIFY